MVYNGIIENYLDLKRMLEKGGHTFKSETDTEIIAHLIQSYLFKGNSFEQSVRNALKRIRGFNIIQYGKKLINLSLYLHHGFKLLKG